MFGFRPGCVTLYLAHIKRLRVIVVSFNLSSHSVQHHTNAGKNTEWFTCMGGAARCLMSIVCCGSAVGTVGGPPAQGGIQILGGTPQFFDCRCVWFERSSLALSTVSSQRFVSMMYHFVSCRITCDLRRFRICLGCVVCFPFVALCLESFGITCDVLIPSVVSSHRSSQGLS